MRYRNVVCTVAAVAASGLHAGSFCSPALAQTAAPTPVAESYHLAPWAKLPPARIWAGVTGIDIAPDGESVWVLDRCAAVGDCGPDSAVPIQKFDASGKRVAAFGAGLFVAPHGLFVDSGNNVWVTDFRGDGVRGHTVMKFSADGKLLLTLGKPGVSGHDAATFNGPADVAVAKNGDIFVADGHEGPNVYPRVVKFDRAGKFIKAWGRTGSAPGEFGALHSIVIDNDGRILVADRVNRRIHVFDQDGNFITAFEGYGRPAGLAVDAKNTLYSLDMDSVDKDGSNDKRSLWIGDAKDGKIRARYTNIKELEDIAVDRAGNIYGGSILQKTFGRVIRD